MSVNDCEGMFGKPAAVYRWFRDTRGNPEWWAKRRRLRRHVHRLRALGHTVYEEFRLLDDQASHPMSFQDYEAFYASRWIYALRPRRVVDVGSYKQFVAGVAAGYEVLSIDVRRPGWNFADNVEARPGDIRRLPLADDSVELLTCLCVLEHVGLGRYGDEFDLEGDRRALAELHRVLRPGGHLILSTQIGRPCILFNAGRVYDRPALRDMCGSFTVIDEEIFLRADNRVTTVDQASDVERWWDVYLCVLRKPGP